MLQEVAKQEGFRVTFMPAPFANKFMGMYAVCCIIVEKCAFEDICLNHNLPD